MMWEMFQIIAPSALAAAIIMIMAYWACRAISHMYICKEDQLEYEHELKMHMMESSDEDYRQVMWQQRAYENNRRLIQAAGDRAKNLSMDIIRQINASRLEQAKEVLGDVTNFMNQFKED